jgi:hypothetical protein
MNKSLKDIPPLEHHPHEFAWNMHPTDPMSMVVYHWGQPVMILSLQEAIESGSRTEILKHIQECDNTPWLTRWQEEKHAALVTVLSADYVHL